MSQELGKIERPPVEEYRKGRKLFFVPLLFAPREGEADLREMVDRYWNQVEAQVSKLEGMLQEIRKVYHELIPVGGEKGGQAIAELNSGSYRIVERRLKKGAQLQPIEDVELLTEFMDWSKCLTVGLQNEKVFARVYEAYAEAQRKRNGYIAKQIDETLKDDENGLLLLREGHRVQFPSDIQVFYVAPPGLDEIHRWLREQAAKKEELRADREAGGPKTEEREDSLN